MTKTVWVFNGERGQLPAGIFTTREAAESWIRERRLSGTLSEFPLDVSAYDHAVGERLFTPKKTHEFTVEFIAGFSPRLDNEHWQDGSTEFDCPTE